MRAIKTSLIYFDQAVRHGSIRRAAEELHIASSAINRQLLQLEEEMGLPLFERLPRGIRPMRGEGGRDRVRIGEIEFGAAQRDNNGALRPAQADEFRRQLPAAARDQYLHVANLSPRRAAS